MFAPFYTVDPAQADRCKLACVNRSKIVETFGAVRITGIVQSVVENLDAAPNSWSITFGPGAESSTKS